MNKLPILLILLIASCTAEQIEDEQIQETNTSSTHKVNGEYCFKSLDHYVTEYIHIDLNNNAVKGVMYGNQDFFGGVYVDFDVLLLSDTTFDITEYGLPDDPLVTQTWKFSFDGTKLEIEGSIGEGNSTKFVLMNCNELPDKNEYGTLENLETEMLGEYLENVFPVYYKSIAPDAMKHNNGLYEYFQILEVLDTITGFGVGMEDGEPNWEFDFTGKIVDDSIYLVKVNYRQEGYEPVTTSEEWINHNNGYLTLKGYNRPENGRLYTSSDPDYFPQIVQDSLKNIDLRIQYHTISPWELYDQRLEQQE